MKLRLLLWWLNPSNMASPWMKLWPKWRRQIPCASPDCMPLPTMSASIVEATNKVYWNSWANSVPWLNYTFASPNGCFCKLQQLFVASIFALLCMCKPAGLFASLVTGYGKPFHHGVMHIEVRHMAACNWVLKWWPPLPTWTWRIPSACTLFWGLQCSLPSMVCSWTGLFWHGLIQSRLIHRIYFLKCLEHRWATMMSSSKSQDGYSKILHKADCDKLKGLHKRKSVDHCEHFGFI